MKTIIEMPVHMSPEKTLLWQRIRDFTLDNNEAALPFSRKLAREQHWSYSFTSGAIEEYRRFIFLCCIAPRGASPSTIVDKVWHLHLLYTQNYWEDFCKKTLGRKLHHHPSGGGTDENKKHADWRKTTLELYRSTFGIDPPALYWDDTSNKTAQKTRRPGTWKLVICCCLLLLLAGCNNLISTIGPVMGIGFLLFFGGLILASLSENKSTDAGKKKTDDTGGGCSGGGSSCSSGCGGGGGCGGGCGGCGGGCGGA
ncbi:glycine-rich domain-containing protein [Niabella beijingensis]|uniref:glycine-rich domain-containing protein n=1 Tax=Niabella beijingensis TaxID=2872700 RepID=UPI001CBC8625|nr:hypothetical protein [Niabella beijingensis]MBZ4188573.1 hypothetical protein [Niabella beijingensis]